MRRDRAVNMLATLKMIRERYGGPEQYIIDRCGLTKEDVRRIRSNLVVKAVATQALWSQKIGWVYSTFEYVAWICAGLHRIWNQNAVLYWSLLLSELSSSEVKFSLAIYTTRFSFTNPVKLEGLYQDSKLSLGWIDGKLLYHNKSPKFENRWVRGRKWHVTEIFRKFESSEMILPLSTPHDWTRIR
jgi:hypothetical protein